MALIEETVMRGVMHTAIERESGSLGAALLTAPLFAVVHFFAKARIPAEELSWGSGFDLIQRSFAPLAHPALVFDSFLSWLLVGLILSLTRVLTGNIAVAIGLHAGWVLVLRMLQEATTTGSAPAYSFWVGPLRRIVGLLDPALGCADRRGAVVHARTLGAEREMHLERTLAGTKLTHSV